MFSKSLSFCVCVCGSAFCLSSEAQDAATATPGKSASEPITSAAAAPAASQPSVPQDGSPPSYPPEISVRLQEIFELQQKNRYVEALEKLEVLEKEMPNLADVHNLKGALYLSPALRDYDKAETHFNRALELSPGSPQPHFNKAELRFVKHEWSAAQTAFEKVLADYPKLPLQVRHLVHFKALICEIKQDKVSVAEDRLKAQFTFMDDTPAYYFSKAALSYHQKKNEEAEDWVKRAAGIFKPQDNAAFMDALMEARWVANIALPPAP